MGSSRQTEEVAAAWLARRDGGSWDEAERAAFTEWLQASMAHRVAFLRLEAAWQQTDRLRALGAGTEPGIVPEPGAWLPPPVLDAAGIRPRPADKPGDGQARGREAADADYGRFRQRLGALAAAVLVATTLGAGWFLWPPGTSYHTAVGGLASVPMPDGSHVTLNTDSEIRVAVTEEERRVNLRHGEAFFDVAEDPQRPFVVYAGDRRVTAIGTKFAVRHASGDIRIVVTEGRVRVEPVKGEAPATQLSAGAIAHAGTGGTLVQERPFGEAEECLSWRRGFLVFRDTRLDDAAAEFNRYNTRKVVIDTAAVAAIRIDGSFRSTNVDAFVRLIEQGFPIRAEYQDRQIVLKAA